jgi:hypothetical protein
MVLVLRNLRYSRLVITRLVQSRIDLRMPSLTGSSR